MAKPPAILLGSQATWKVHTPNLLQEILTNNGMAMMHKPIAIFGRLLAEVAERAAVLDDPALNILMLRLTLYDAGDPVKHAASAITAIYAEQDRRAAALSAAAARTTFNIGIKDATAETLADELERIAAMIRDGFTSGDVAGTGWWTTANINQEEDAS